jgi:hypothetical protein
MTTVDQTHFLALTFTQEAFSITPFVLLRIFPAGHALQEPTSGAAAAEYFPEGHCKVARFDSSCIAMQVSPICSTNG